MAITYNQQPSAEVSLSGNPLIWVFSSNQTGQVNFSYYVEVYVDAVLNSSHQVFPESGIYGKFDVSQIAESVLSAPNYPTALAGLDVSTVDINLIVHERYGTTPTLQASLLSTVKLVIKGKLFMNEWINSDIDDYYLNANGKKFLTQCPLFNLIEGESLFLYSLLDEISNPILHINYKDSSGVSVHNESISNTGYRLNAYNVSYTVLESYYSLASISTVDVYIEALDGLTTEVITININQCTPIESKRLHFLNQLGGIDPFTFDAVSKQSMTTQTNSFLTTQGGFNGAAYTYSTTNSQSGNYQVTSNTKLMLESNWITEDVMQWLNDNLFTSPYILLETANGLQRVANTSASVKYKKNRNDMAFNVVIELDLEMHSSMII